MSAAFGISTLVGLVIILIAVAHQRGIIDELQRKTDRLASNHELLRLRLSEREAHDEKVIDALMELINVWKGRQNP